MCCVMLHNLAVKRRLQEDDVKQPENDGAEIEQNADLPVDNNALLYRTTVSL